MVSDKKIAIIGLGYVGLPLALAFGKKYLTVAFDIDEKRVSELKNGNDRTLEADKSELLSLQRSKSINITSNLNDLLDSNFYIVTVPTPVDKNNKPDLQPLIKASAMIGKIIKKGDIVVYESTVYPGATEEVCVPIIEQNSNFLYNKDFFVGYSPERINPGDKLHTLTKILKITSGSTIETAEIIDSVYKSIIEAGTFKASSIKVAEAAKVIENSQRDINIAFVNELSKIFNLLKINTNEVLEAAGTKWNFINFKPGLVGGHCIGVDPYYLAQKAQEVGYHPEIILAGRRMNDSMGKYIVSETIKLMVNKGLNINNSRILILGFTFKENCPDVRNTKVIDIINEFKFYNSQLIIVDPWANPQEVLKEYNLNLSNTIPNDCLFDAVVLAVSHNEFSNIDILQILQKNHVIFDVKGLLNKEIVDGHL